MLIKCTVVKQNTQYKQNYYINSLYLYFYVYFVVKPYRDILLYSFNLMYLLCKAMKQ